MKFIVLQYIEKLKSLIFNNLDFQQNMTYNAILDWKECKRDRKGREVKSD